MTKKSKKKKKTTESDASLIHVQRRVCKYVGLEFSNVNINPPSVHFQKI